MDMIVLRRGREPWRWNFRHYHAAIAIVAGGLLVGGLGYGGYVLGVHRAPARLLAKTQRLRHAIARQTNALSQLRTQSQGAINAVAARMARLDAQVNRLDAMGAEIVHLAGLKKSGFNFKSPAGEGGPEPATEYPWKLGGLHEATDALSSRIWQERRKLTALESLLVHKKLSTQIVPRGKPVQGAWISSGWGWRTDPITGEREFHQGIDFADHEGSRIHAIAAGVVTWAGPRYGYGNLVIINDGDGYVTYYAHNEKILVKVGDIVKRGEVISLMGETGMATGPHVHLEIHHDGKPVDPWRYVMGKASVG